MVYRKYENKCVLVTGGLGFIGSNLTIRLAELGARVTVLDSCVEHCGSHRDNVHSVRDSIHTIIADISEFRSIAHELSRPDLIFNLAGEVSHSRSMERPLRDLELNAMAQLAFLNTCAEVFPGVRIVYASTRQVYGVPEFLPVTEDHPIQPVDFNGVHKFAACAYHQLLSRLGLIDALVLRLTNVYGPRMALDVKGQGFLSVYLRNALQGKPIQILGDGRQLRDPVHVDDVVDAFLRAGLSSSAYRIFNVAGPEPLEIRQIAAIAATTGNCPIIHREFTAAEKAIDIGSYYADASRIRRELQWEPRIRFEEGFPQTLRSYETERVPVETSLKWAVAASGTAS